MAEEIKKSRSLRDFGVRAISAGAIGVAFIGSIFWGGPFGLAVVVAVVGVLAALEFYAILRRERRLPNELFGLAAVAAMPFAAALLGTRGLTATVSALVIGSLAWHIIFRQVRSTDTAVTVYGAVYVGFTLAHLVLIRELDAGAELALATVASVWVNDTFAYLVGTSIGRHPMAPHISPKKSWEGFIAGTIFTTGVWVAVGYLADTGLSLGWLVLVGLAASVAAVVGDLAESRLKREASVKDSGTLLPGHGGFLDRFDSMILVSIVTYYMLVFAGAK
ncbi:MAG: phosphatidate cytidylyltransferase [Actinomycetota bacterium]|nr:MAG: CDP-diglyceride [Actinomycetota bacterium]MDP3630237.1 phosphatidate cytidylyltransferase [Actinomycetota bacterium]